MQDENGIVRKPIGLHEMKRILGTINADTGVICTSNNINMWAKNKPVNSNKKGELSPDERTVYQYGMKQDSNGYWYYEKPTTEYRVFDFDGYNHNAEAPMKPLNAVVPASFNTALNQILLQPDDFFAKGPNVELSPLIERLYTGSYYIGLLFQNRRTGAMRYYTDEITLYDYFTTGKTSQGQMISLAQLSSSKGDIIDAWVCSARTYVEGGDGAVCTQTMLNSGAVMKMAITETLGHTYLTVAGFALSDLYYTGGESTVASSSSGELTKYITRFTTELWCTHWFDPAENIELYFELTDGSGNLIGTKVMNLGRAKLDNIGVFPLVFSNLYAGPYRREQGEYTIPVDLTLTVYNSTGGVKQGTGRWLGTGRADLYNNSFSFNTWPLLPTSHMTFKYGSETVTNRSTVTASSPRLFLENTFKSAYTRYELTLTPSNTGVTWEYDENGFTLNNLDRLGSTTLTVAVKCVCGYNTSTVLIFYVKYSV